VQMKTRVAGVLTATAAAVAMMGAPAFAQSGNGDSGVLSILSGNNVNAPVTVPVNVCGNAVAILGFADAGCQGGAGALLLDSFNG
jgi:hypothetical protein